jgi:hypothetical protein
VNGLLLPVNDPEALAEQITKTWNNKKLIHDAIIANRKLVEEKADFKKNMPVFIDWYKNLIKG